MQWIKHILGAATLPQKCVRCGVTLIEDKKNKDTGAAIAEALDRQGEALYRAEEEDGRVTIALQLPPDVKAEECSKS